MLLQTDVIDPLPLAAAVSDPLPFLQLSKVKVQVVQLEVSSVFSGYSSESVEDEFSLGASSAVLLVWGQVLAGEGCRVAFMNYYSKDCMYHYFCVDDHSYY